MTRLRMLKLLHRSKEQGQMKDMSESDVKMKAYCVFEVKLKSTLAKHMKLLIMSLQVEQRPFIRMHCSNTIINMRGLNKALLNVRVLLHETLFVVLLA